MHDDPMRQWAAHDAAVRAGRGRLPLRRLVFIVLVAVLAAAGCSSSRPRRGLGSGRRRSTSRPCSPASPLPAPPASMPGEPRRSCSRSPTTAMTARTRRSTPRGTRSGPTAPMPVGRTVLRSYVRRGGHRRARARARPHPVGPPQPRRPGRGRLPDDRARRAPALLRGPPRGRVGRDQRTRHLSQRHAPSPSRRTPSRPTRSSRAWRSPISRPGSATPAAPSSLDGQPAGIAAREFGGKLGFTPLGEGFADLGLTLCTDPDCGLAAP